ncbi:MAG: flavodoxin-dependent (E)-4-hydroxy-3-methylbut-2-enyl-diphosphate synthase [Bacilli bacterium]
MKKNVFKRTQTRSVFIAGLQVGGQNRVIIQSMCSLKTAKIDAVVQQINECARLGAELMRLAILDQEDALAIKKIKPQVNIPLIADIHFDYRLALLALENGIDGLRINPGNIGNKEGIKLLVEKAKEKKVPIRIGVNSGSFDREIHDYQKAYEAKHLLASAQKHVAIFEELDFHDIVISLKASDVLTTIAAYRLAAKTFPYPLHLGITEAGPAEIGIIRSSAGLAPLLLEGLGDTIRISLSASPQEEIVTAKRLLHDLGLYPNYPTLISCPTCGRTEVDLIPLAKRVLSYLETVHLPIKVAVMGCVVNGPGEAKSADIGIAGGKGRYAIFKKGQVVQTVQEDEAFATFIREIEKLK